MVKRSLFILSLVAAFASTGYAATSSNTATVALSATVGSSITISPITGVSLGTVLPGQTSTVAATTTVTMNWNLAPSYSALELYAYFSNAAQAMTDAQATPSYIPSSAVKVKATTTTGTNNIASYTAITGTNPGFGGAGASLLIKTVNISGTNKTTTNDQTTLDFQLDLTGQTGVAAGDYTGTLNIQAQATP